MIPKAMGNLNKVCKGLTSFVCLWESMANDDASGEFRRMNKPLLFYWKAVTATLDIPICAPSVLQNGFWPKSRCEPTFKDRFMDDGTL